MAQVDQGKFSCKQCGKTYKWKPEFAGKKVKCKCGYVMTAPAQMSGASDEPDLDALYDLADEGKAAAAAAPAMIRCPSCQSDLAPGTTVCESCGFNLKTGSKSRRPAAAVAGAGATVAASMRGGGGAAVAAAPTGALPYFSAFGTPRRELQKDEITENNLLDYYIPIGLIVVGMILSILQASKFNARVYSTSDAMIFVGAKLVVSLVLLAVGSMLCIKWGEVAFGAPAPAALKMAGMALAPAALANIVSFMIHDLWGLVGFSIAFGLYFILCHYLFEWDMSEKWIVTFMLCVVCVMGAPFLADKMLETAEDAGVRVASKAVANEDASIDYMIELGSPKDARKWIDDSSNRILGDLPRGTSKQAIDDIYALRPQEVWIIPDGPQAAEVLVKLPKDKAKRKAIYDWYAAFLKANHPGSTPMPDNGGKWLVIVFSPVPHPEPPGF